VGANVDSRSRDQQPLIALSTLQFVCKYTKAGWSLRIQLHGDNKPTSAGMHVNACRSFATTDLNSFNGIV
jgi:hypothetical protein